MKTIKSKSEERLIVDVVMNGKKLPMLIDTGATVSLVSDRVKGLAYDPVRPDVPLEGIGGKASGRRVITQGTIGGRVVNQFLATDIRNIRNSIERETGIAIEGVVGLKQLMFAGVVIDASNGVIMIPEE